MNKVKEICSKIITKLKSIPKKNLIISVVIILLVISTITTILIVNSKRLTKLEEIKIKEVNEKIAEYLEEYLNNQEDEGRYINFAIEYLSNTTNKNEYTSEEIVKTIKEFYNQDITSKKLLEIGITPKMLEKGITYDSTKDSYTYKDIQTRADIAKTKVIKYEMSNIKKINKEKFIVSYDKYVVESPYDIYNYYNEKSINGENYDEILNKIKNYLIGKEKVKVIKDIITKEDIENYGKKDGTIEVEFVIKDNNLVINR